MKRTKSASLKTIHAYARDYRGKLKHQRFETERQAEHWKEEMAKERDAIREGRALPSKGHIRLEQYSPVWLQEKMKESTTSTVYGYAGQLRTHVLPFLGTRKMSELHQLELESFLDHVQDKHGLSNATRNRIRAMLSSMWNDARKLRVVEANPFELIEQKKENPQAAVTLWTLDEAKAYLKAALEMGWCEYVFCHLGLNTGMRKGEMIALQLKHIHLEAGAIRVEQMYDQAEKAIVQRLKSDGTRKVQRAKYVGITGTLRAVLEEHYKRHPGASPEDFLLTRNGKMLTPRQANCMNDRIIARAGIRHARVHDNRHLAGSLMKEELGDIHGVKEQLGHSTVTTTERYVHAGMSEAARRGQKFNPFEHVSSVSDRCPEGPKPKVLVKVVKKSPLNKLQ